MAAERHSVVLHYEQSTDELVVFSVPSGKALALKAASGLELPLKALRRLDHDEAERRVGAGILHLVESFGGAKLGLRDYEGEFEKELEQWIADLENGPQTPQSQFELATLYRDLALRRRSQQLFDKSKALTEA